MIIHKALACKFLGGKKHMADLAMCLCLIFMFFQIGLNLASVVYFKVFFAGQGFKVVGKFMV